MKFILGKKIGMSQVFTEGEAIPVTIIEAGPCYITQIKNKEKDDYNAVQIGFAISSGKQGKTKKLKKSQEGHLKKLNIKRDASQRSLRDKQKLEILREFRVEDLKILENLKIGDEINVSVFKPDDKVDVTGISKGRGFSGVIKRWGFSRGPMSHGSDHHREPGSIGSMFPQRVFPGKKLPGRYGQDTVTLKNLKVINVDSEKNLLAVKGAVPGAKGKLLIIKTSK